MYIFKTTRCSISNPFLSICQFSLLLPARPWLGSSVRSFLIRLKKHLALFATINGSIFFYLMWTVGVLEGSCPRIYNSAGFLVVPDQYPLVYKKAAGTLQETVLKPFVIWSIGIRWWRLLPRSRDMIHSENTGGIASFFFQKKN